MRSNALENFLSRYPGSERRYAARDLLLTTYLAADQPPKSALHQLCEAMIQARPAGLERWEEEARVGIMLADAGDHGIDLPDAESFTRDAQLAFGEQSYARELLVLRRRYKLPALSASAQRQQYRHERATLLSARADVLQDEGQLQAADALVTEALHADPENSLAHRLRGQILYAQGQHAEALTSFVQAEALRPLPPRWHTVALQLFNERQPKTAASLDEAVDQAYTDLFPRPFALPAQPAPKEGHPALLELFTGSDCLPCAGPDLAVHSLLGSFQRSELIALEFDEHVPSPDPLATAETEQRAAAYGVQSTPTAFLDGQPLQILGSSRADVENIVVSFADEIEAVASQPSSLHLTLRELPRNDGIVLVQPTLELRPAAAPPSGESVSTSGTLRMLQQATLYVALVQDALRYPGANGVRMHHMVVRSVQQLPAAGVLLAAGRAPTLQFNLQQIQAANSAYLNNFERDNDSFGAVHFPTTDFPLVGQSLSAVAWVQDPISHRVLQSVFLALSGH